MDQDLKEILKGVYALAELVQQRITLQEATSGSIQQRMALIESRLLEIERRLNLRPAA